MSWAPGCKWWLPLDADRVRQVAWCEAERPPLLFLVLLFPVLHWRGSGRAGVLHPRPSARGSRPGLSGGRGEHGMLAWSVECVRGWERFIELSRKCQGPEAGKGQAQQIKEARRGSRTKFLLYHTVLHSYPIRASLFR